MICIQSIWDKSIDLNNIDCVSKRTIIYECILGEDPELSPVPKNKTIVACGVHIRMFRAKARPGNICFNRLRLGLTNIKDMSVWE